MAIIYWTNGAGGQFISPGNWSTDTVPGRLDQAKINASGTYLVTTIASLDVLSLSTGAGVTFIVQVSVNFGLLEGTGLGANYGNILIEGGGTLMAGGTIDNKGTIQINGGSQLLLGQASLSLSGGGKVILADASSTECDITTNVDNNISGAGTASLSNNEKEGVINATGTFNPLVINTNDQTLINAGTLEDTGLGGLDLYGTIDGSSGGLIEANGALSNVNLNAVTLIGGTLETSGGGAIQATGCTFDGIKATVNNAATLSFVTAAFEGTINNTGMIEVTNTSNEDGSLFIGPAGATFEGEGTISLSYSSITGNAVGATLTNVNNTIDGFGVIGDTDDNGSNNTLTLINGLKGVIDGSSTAEPLVIDTGTNIVKNNGTLEATGSGELYIASRVTNSGILISASGGDLVAAGAVSGGRAAIYGPGVIEFGAASSVATTFALGSTGELILDDAAQYTGTVSGFGKNITQSIDLSNVQFATASKTYSSGTLTVKDTAGDIAHIKLSGSYTLASFTLSNDGNGGTLINDPPVAKTTLTTGVDIALFGNYIASSLVGGSIGQGGSLSANASALLSPLLATPAHA